MSDVITVAGHAAKVVLDDVSWFVEPPRIAPRIALKFHLETEAGLKSIQFEYHVDAEPIIKSIAPLPVVATTAMHTGEALNQEIKARLGRLESNVSEILKIINLIGWPKR